MRFLLVTETGVANESRDVGGRLPAEAPRVRAARPVLGAHGGPAVQDPHRCRLRASSADRYSQLF